MANSKKTTAATEQGRSMAFLALKPYLERTIITPREEVVAGADWVRWGDKNSYPQYLEGLSAECTTLRTIQMGLIDYIGGNGTTVEGMPEDNIDGHGMTARELVRATGKDIARLGGWAWELIPDKNGDLAEVHPMRLKYVRTNKEGDVVYYSEKWTSARSTGGVIDALVYPRWSGAFARDPKTGAWRSAVLLVKCWGDNVYPEPIYAAAVKCCEIERGVDEFHLGNLERGFMGNYIVNFCNGIPTDPEKAEIEKNINQKFAGTGNAGRILMNFAVDKDHLATIAKMDVADFADKYATLVKHCRQQIFTSFRAAPVLFGIPTDNNGFSVDDYDNAFRLFNRTIVRPLQELICEAWEKATGGAMTIEPFTIEGAEEAAGEGTTTTEGEGGPEA